MTTRLRAPQIRMMALVSALMAATALAAPVMAQSAPAPHVMQAQPSISLSADGEVKVAPDMATITFGVVTEAPTAAEAMAQNAARMTQVIAALRRAGISERDIQTSGLNLSAQYDYVQNEPPRLRGYQASNRVTVVINDVNAVGTTADAVVAAGVNQIDGITFGLKNPKAAEDQARRAAVAALQSKASLYADALGVRLGGIRSLNEGGPDMSQPPVFVGNRMAMAADMESTPVAPGELTVRIDITGVYDIVR